MKIYRFLKADYTKLTIISHICPLLVQFFFIPIYVTCIWSMTQTAVTTHQKV